MKKLMFCAVLAAAASGCVMVGKTNAAAPIELDVQSPDTSFIDNSVKPVKCGRATSKGVVIYTSGDSSIKAAMDNGGITKVHHIDYEVFNILNLFSKATTIVYGE